MSDSVILCAMNGPIKYTILCVALASDTNTSIAKNINVKIELCLSLRIVNILRHRKLRVIIITKKVMFDGCMNEEYPEGKVNNIKAI